MIFEDYNSSWSTIYLKLKCSLIWQDNAMLCHTMNYMGILVIINFLAMVIKKSIIHFIAGENHRFLFIRIQHFHYFLQKPWQCFKMSVITNILLQHGKYMTSFPLCSQLSKEDLLWLCWSTVSEKNRLSAFALLKEWMAFSWKSSHTPHCIVTLQTLYWLLIVFTLALEYKASLERHQLPRHMVTCLEVRDNN